MTRVSRALLTSAICVFALCCIQGAAHSASSGAAESLGWQLGMQSYTFKSVSFFEAIDKNLDLGMKYIEAFPNQKISPDSDATLSYKMAPADRERILAKLRDSGVQLLNYGVIRGKGAEDWRQIFGFAKAMGIRTLVSEPALDELDIVEKLADEFGVNVAFHNHPQPSIYWNPETVLSAVEGRGKRLGACADIGHWLRSGLDPIECVKQLEGRIISFHFKDLDKKEAADTPKAERTAHDVPWGSGVGNTFALLSEIKRQGFKGSFLIEYEYNWDQAEPEIARCVSYFNLAAQALVQDGYQPLFKADLSDATFTQGTWGFEEGVLSPSAKSNIWTNENYGDFVLDLAFKCDAETNSGVFIRTTDTVNWLHTGIEIQILQPENPNAKKNCGAIYDCLGPAKRMLEPAGEWNRFIIMAEDNMVHVILNGEQVVYADLGQWTEAHKNPDGTPNKFKTAYKDLARSGHVGLQYHGHPVWFRDMQIKRVER